MNRSLIMRIAGAVTALFALSLAVGSIGGGDADTAAVTGPVPRDGAAALGFEGQNALGRQRDAQSDVPAVAPDDGVSLQDIGFDDRIIRTAELGIEVGDGSFDAAWDRVLAVADRFGGSVLTTSRGTGAQRDEAAFGELTLRVPADRFGDAVVALRGIGEIRRDRTSSQDVTEEYVDLTSRLRHLRAQEDALLKLMDRARSVQDILVVQRELANTQAEIERVTGRLNFLDSRTEFSTIAVQLGEPGVFTLLEQQSDGPSFAEAWATAIEGLERMATATMIGAMWAAPFVVLGLIALRLRRSRSPAHEV